MTRTPPVIVFCEDPAERGTADADFAAEAVAAQAAGFDVALIDFESLAWEGDVRRALRRVPAARGEETTGVYRGWMLRVEAYAALYEGLAARGVRLVNSPEAYRACHHLPEAYPYLEGVTPRTVWRAVEPGAAPDGATLDALLGPFGAAPVVVKDFVKSRKHEWAEACFLPDASDRDAAARVIGTFVARQGPDLTGGVVVREWVELAPLGAHPKSGMPLAREYRRFVLDGRPLLTLAYWPEADYGAEATPPDDLFTEIAARVPSRFFSLDLARRSDSGDWLIVEPGDGQVAGLPHDGAAPDFYRRLAAGLARDRGW